MAKRINRIALIAVATTYAAGGWATPLSPEQALERLEDIGTHDLPLSKGKIGGVYQLAITEKAGDENTIYAFNKRNNGGFVVVSADDATLPLLGYSDTGSIPEDPSQRPDGFVYWIDMLSQRVAMAREAGGRTIPKKIRPEREAIAPLCDTKWNQSEPFNNTCPLSNRVHCYTGCVATAMAQAMKYHNWPEKGEGTASYSWGRLTLKENFANTTYQWDKMLDEYTPGNYSEEEASAVAAIMKSAGYSVEMNYSTSGSGAASILIAPALGNNFRYDKSTLRYHQRNYHYLTEWEDLIYASLKEDGPVIYDGQSYAGGHSFICDGYQGDGYFHFNWGWGGMSDGWFLLDALDPIEQGIGGSASMSGFNFQQDVITGIRPDRTGDSQWTAALRAQTAFEISTNITYKAGDEMAIGGFVYNVGPGVIPADTELGLSFCAEGAAEPIIFGAELGEQVRLMYGFDRISYTFPEIADGSYYMTLCFRYPGAEWEDIEVPVYDSGGYYVKVENGTATLTADEDAWLESTGFEFQLTGNTLGFTAKATVENPTDGPFFSFIDALLLDSDGRLVSVGRSLPWDMEGGETRELEYISEFTTPVLPGEYLVCLATETSTEYIPFTEMLPMTVKESTGVVESIESEIEAPAEYYDLNGVRVTEPGRGSLVIRRQGGRSALRLR